MVGKNKKLGFIPAAYCLLITVCMPYLTYTIIPRLNILNLGPEITLLKV